MDNYGEYLDTLRALQPIPRVGGPGLTRLAKAEAETEALRLKGQIWALRNKALRPRGRRSLWVRWARFEALARMGEGDLCLARRMAMEAWTQTADEGSPFSPADQWLADESYNWGMKETRKIFLPNPDWPRGTQAYLTWLRSLGAFDAFYEVKDQIEKEKARREGR